MCPPLPSVATTGRATNLRPEKYTNVRTQNDRQTGRGYVRGGVDVGLRPANVQQKNRALIKVHER